MSHLDDCLKELGPGIPLLHPKIPIYLDSKDSLLQFREQFILPTLHSVGATLISEGDFQKSCIYLCGNSLGALPKRSRTLIEEELTVWGNYGVEGHFTSHPHNRGWMRIADTVLPSLSRILGAKQNEIACMGTLTSNLHLMMTTFYKPVKGRFKILCEARAFPSDQYAFASQALLHGYDPTTAVVELAPRPGEFALQESDILEAISKHGESLALVLFSGVQYYTGQFFPIERITRAAHEQGAICGWDLAHAVGNVPLSLHSWDIDFAVWCSYKYLNSGPGGIGGLFIHEKWEGRETPKLAGWWGHDEATRFQMPPRFSAIPGAQGFQQSNPSVLATVSLLGSLQVFDLAGGIEVVRRKSVELTRYFDLILQKSKYFVELPEWEGAQRAKVKFTIITPSLPDFRGAQLSLLFDPPNVMQKVFDGLKRRGVVGDERQPDVIRLTPVPLYNSFEDCWKGALALEEVLKELDN